MKKNLMGLLACAFLVGCSSFYDISEKKDLDRQVVYSKNLVVNSKNKVRYYSNKSEEEGIQDLRNLIDTAKKEEAYAFIKAKKYWIEIGYNERNNKKRFDKVEINNKLLNDLACEYNEISLWHFHKKIECDFDRYSKYKEATPSPSDGLNSLRSNERLRKLNPEIKIKFGVASTHGESYMFFNKEKQMPAKETEFLGVEELMLSINKEIITCDLISLIKQIKEDNPNLDKSFKYDLLEGEITLQFDPIKR